MSCVTRLRSCGSERAKSTMFLELGSVTALSPAVVVPVLLAAARVHSGRLDEGPSDPSYVLPRRRDRQFADALERLLVRDLPSLLVDVGEAPALARRLMPGPEQSIVSVSPMSALPAPSRRKPPREA